MFPIISNLNTRPQNVFKKDLTGFLSTHSSSWAIESLDGYSENNNFKENINLLINYLKEQGFDLNNTNALLIRTDNLNDQLLPHLHLTLKSIVEIYMNLDSNSSQITFKNDFKNLELHECNQGFLENLGRMLQFGQGLEAYFHTHKYTTLEALALEYVQQHLLSGQEYEVHDTTSVLLVVNNKYHLNVKISPLTTYLINFNYSEKRKILSYFKTTLKEDDFIKNFFEAFYHRCQKSILGEQANIGSSISGIKFDTQFSPQFIQSLSEDSQLHTFKLQGVDQKIILLSKDSEQNNSSLDSENSSITLNFEQLSLKEATSENQDKNLKEFVHSLTFKLQLQLYNECESLSSEEPSIITPSKSIDLLHQLLEEKLPVSQENFTDSDREKSSHLARLLAPYELNKLSEQGFESSIKFLIDYRLFKSELLSKESSEDLKEDLEILIQVAQQQNPNSLDLTEITLLKTLEKRGLVDVYMNILTKKILFSLYEQSDIANIPKLLLKALLQELEALNPIEYPKLHTNLKNHFILESLNYLMFCTVEDDLKNKIIEKLKTFVGTDNFASLLMNCFQIYGVDYVLEPVFKEALKNEFFKKEFIDIYIHHLKKGVFKEEILKFLIDSSPDSGQFTLQSLYLAILKEKYSTRSIQVSSETEFDRTLEQHGNYLRETYRDDPFLMQILTLTDLSNMHDLFLDEILLSQDPEKLYRLVAFENEVQTLENLYGSYTTFKNLHLNFDTQLGAILMARLLSALDNLTHLEFIEALAEIFASHACPLYKIENFYNPKSDEVRLIGKPREKIDIISDTFPFLKTDNEQFISIFFYKIFEKQFSISKSGSYHFNPLIWICHNMHSPIKFNKDDNPNKYFPEESRYLDILLGSEFIDAMSTSFFSVTKRHQKSYYTHFLNIAHQSKNFNNYLNVLKKAKSTETNHKVFIDMIFLYITNYTSIISYQEKFSPVSLARAMKNFIDLSTFSYDHFIESIKTLDSFLLECDQKNLNSSEIRKIIDIRVGFLAKKVSFTEQEAQSLLNLLSTLHIQNKPEQLKHLRRLLLTDSFLQAVHKNHLKQFIDDRDFNQLCEDDFLHKVDPSKLGLEVNSKTYKKIWAARRFNDQASYDPEIYQNYFNEIQNLNHPQKLDLIQKRILTKELYRKLVSEDNSAGHGVINGLFFQLNLSTPEPPRSNFFQLSDSTDRLFKSLLFDLSDDRYECFKSLFFLARDKERRQNLLRKIAQYSDLWSILLLTSEISTIIKPEDVNNLLDDTLKENLFYSFLKSEAFEQNPINAFTFLKNYHILPKHYESKILEYAENDSCFQNYLNKALKLPDFKNNFNTLMVQEDLLLSLLHNFVENKKPLAVTLIESLNDDLNESENTKINSFRHDRSSDKSKVDKLSNKDKIMLLKQAIINNYIDFADKILEIDILLEFDCKYLDESISDEWRSCLDILLEKYLETNNRSDEDEKLRSQYLELIKKCLDQGANPKAILSLSSKTKSGVSKNNQIKKVLTLAKNYETTYKKLTPKEYHKNLFESRTFIMARTEFESKLIENTEEKETNKNKYPKK